MISHENWYHVSLKCGLKLGKAITNILQDKNSMKPTVYKIHLILQILPKIKNYSNCNFLVASRTSLHVQSKDNTIDR